MIRKKKEKHIDTKGERRRVRLFEGELVESGEGRDDAGTQR